MKLLRDEKDRIERAQETAEARGEARGRVLALQEYLSLPVSSKEELDLMSIEDMLQLYNKLRQRSQQSPEERIAYLARQKFLRDRQWRLDNLVHLEKRGELVGEIRVLQKRLGIPNSSKEQFAAMSFEELEKLLKDVRRSFDSRA